jgi:peptidyl-prolyl cis-trans isomerase C
MRRSLFGVSLVVLASAFGIVYAQPTEPSPADRQRRDKVVAEIGDLHITLGDLEDRINKQSPFLRARYTDPEKRREFLDNMVRFELLAKAAKKRGYDRQDEVRRQVKQMEVQTLMRKEFDEKISPESVTTQEVQGFYDSHRSDYVKPEMVRASHILVADRARAEELLKKARDPETDNRIFRQLAQESSEDAESKARGGDLRYFARPAERTPEDPEVASEVAEAAFALKNVGDVAPRLVKVASGFSIIKLTGRRPAVSRSIEDATPQIRNRLWREKRQKSIDDFVANLRKNRAVEIHEELLNLIVIPAGGPAGDEGPMPGPPGGKLGVPPRHPEIPRRTPGPPGDPGSDRRPAESSSPD